MAVTATNIATADEAKLHCGGSLPILASPTENCDAGSTATQLESRPGGTVVKLF
jgi:hypothetical protein